MQQAGVLCGSVGGAPRPSGALAAAAAPRRRRQAQGVAVAARRPPVPAASAAAPDRAATANSGPTVNPTPVGQFSLGGSLLSDGGPPRVVSLVDPSLPGADRAHLPLLLYLPGIDGTGLAASRQFPALLRKFDLQALVTPPEDRTPFADLVATVCEFLREEVPRWAPTRPVYLLGESFGGVMALAVAAECPELVDRLVLVNPATSFPRSLWPLIGPLLPQVPAELYRGLPILLAPVLGNPINLLAAALSAPGEEGPRGVQEAAGALVETATRLLGQLPVLAEILPADTLAWKLQLLQDGNTYIAPLLARVQQRTFVLVGGQDMLIPSKEEGQRLQRLLPRAHTRLLEGRSHALLQEGGVDLCAILEEEGFYVQQRRMSAPPKKRTAAAFGSPAPVELPTPKELDRYAEGTTAVSRRLNSPVFISTSPEGVRQLGLGAIPEGRPLLLVGNHQTLALDLGPLCEQFLRERGILPRGLAHPVIFAQSFGGSSSGADGSGSSGEGEPGSASSSGERGRGSAGVAPWDPSHALGSAFGGRQGGGPLAGLLGGNNSGNSGATDGRSSFKDFMTTFGAVPVSAFNMHRLLAGGETVLLFPGGVREAYKNKGEDYQLFWPERSEFVRMAARFGATIVPFAAVGVDDSLQIVADRADLERLPFVGDLVRQRSGALPQARRGVSAASDGEESFVSPLAVPRLPPRRLYFLFQQPIITQKEDMKDRERCDAVYREVKQSVEGGLAYLLEQRERDPYSEFLPRALYEGAYGGRQQAPTFPLH